MAAIQKTSGKNISHSSSNTVVPTHLSNINGVSYLVGDETIDGSLRNVGSGGSALLQKRLNGVWTDVQTADEVETTLINSVRTGTGSFLLGELHVMASAGENVIFKNEESNVCWFPTWQGVSPDGTTLYPATVRAYGALDTMMPNGATAASVGQVDATTDIIYADNRGTFAASIVSAETFTGTVIWNVEYTDGIDVLSFPINISVVPGTLFMLPFEVPLTVRIGAHVVVTLKKKDGTFLKVRPSTTMPTKPWYSITTRPFTDSNIYHSGNLSIIDNLTSTSTTDALSAYQGNLLNEEIMAIYKKPPFNEAVSLGLIPGYTRVGALGNNPDVDTGTIPEDVWSAGGVYPWPTSAVSLEVLSSSANDTSAGTGARTITIAGLDINYAPVVQVVTLNGTSVVSIPTSLFRLNSSSVASVGTGGTNAGDITIRRSGGGITQALIPAGISGTRQAVYTVPAGFSLIITQILFDIQSPTGSIARAADMVTYFRGTSGVARKPLLLSTTNGSPYNHESDPPIFAAEKTDVSLVVISVSDNNTAITGAWNGILRDNSVV